MPNPTYRGRFAPSPTGPLHFGSLVTALASYLEARSHKGDWLVRIEDLDPLRESPEATQQILTSLNAHGLIADEPVRLQSECHERYDRLIDQFLAQGHAYCCTCSRKQLQANQGRHLNQCRHQRHPPEQDQPYAVRFALTGELSHWTDQLLGSQSQPVTAEIDDPVIRRKEGFYAYQLAVVADDVDQGITHVVRGSDLLDMTAQQCQIYRAMGATPPHWMHIPVILNEQGQKLSKQNHAPALDDSQPQANLVNALQALGQDTHGLTTNSPVAKLLATATDRWQPSRICRSKT